MTTSNFVAKVSIALLTTCVFLLCLAGIVVAVVAAVEGVEALEVAAQKLSPP